MKLSEFINFFYASLDYLLSQKAVESQCEGQDEDYDNDGELEESFQDVGNHEDVDAQEGEHLGHNSIAFSIVFSI